MTLELTSVNSYNLSNFFECKHIHLSHSKAWLHSNFSDKSDLTLRAKVLETGFQTSNVWWKTSQVWYQVRPFFWWRVHASMQPMIFHSPINNSGKSCGVHWTCLDHLTPSVTFTESLHVFSLITGWISRFGVVTISLFARAMVISVNNLWRWHVWNCSRNFVTMMMLILCQNCAKIMANYSN